MAGRMALVARTAPSVLPTRLSSAATRMYRWPSSGRPLVRGALPDRRHLPPEGRCARRGWHQSLRAASLSARPLQIRARSRQAATPLASGRLAAATPAATTLSTLRGHAVTCLACAAQQPWKRQWTRATPQQPQQTSTTGSNFCTSTWVASAPYPTVICLSQCIGMVWCPYPLDRNRCDQVVAAGSGAG
jgi:hypothetical protein